MGKIRSMSIDSNQTLELLLDDQSNRKKRERY